MKLITKEIEKKFAKIGNQDGIPDPIVVAKFFNPSGGATWYATEYEPALNVGFGYVTGLGTDEWGYFSVSELESIKCPPFGLPIERDIHCGEKKISEHCPELLPQIQKRIERLAEKEKLKNKDKDIELER